MTSPDERRSRFISAEALQARIEEGTAPAILDVRSAWEYSHGHIERAQHVPFWTLAARVADVRASKADEIVVYCGHGPRAVVAAAVLRSAGFEQVRLLEGHWSAWTRAGFPRA